MSPLPQPSSLFALLPGTFARARRSSRTLGLSVLLTTCVVYLLLTTSAPSGNRSGGLLPAISLPSQQQQQHADDSSRPSNYDYLHLTTSVEEWSAHMAHTLGSVFERNAPLGPSEAAPPEWKRQNAIFQQKWNGTETAGLWDTIRLEPPALLLRMRDAHARFLEDAARTMPEYIAPPPPAAVEGGGSGSSQQRRGIVTVGGGKFFPPLLVSLRVLRRTGTALPVEVFVPRRDYEADLELCEAVLPALGARCRVFPEVPPLALDSFQLKVFAVLFSAFDEVLLLDADDFPVRDVAPLFAAPPYAGAGLVVWPDFWGTAVSPLYYLVSGQPPVAVAARPKSETGQLLVDKRRHWRTLLLAAYYNYFPDVYYPLLCQGCIGCGDSETILPAADLLGLPYYYVKTPPLHVGHRMTDGGIQGHVIAQYDAADDYEATTSTTTSSTAAPASFTTLEERLPLRDRARPLFMHASFPKWDAYVLLDHVSQWSDMTRDTQGRPAAAFQEPREDAARIRGVERMAWEEAAWAVCTHGDQVAHWGQQAGKPRPDKVCAKLTAYIRDVLDGEVGAGLGLGPGDVLTPAQE